MICFEVTINVTSKQIIKKEMMEPNVLKLSQPLLIQRALNVDVHNHSPIHQYLVTYSSLNQSIVVECPLNKNVFYQ